MEYPHVILCGDWAGASARSATEEERRVFYVGMTRAKESLAIINRADRPIPFSSELVSRILSYQLIDSCANSLAHRLDKPAYSRLFQLGR